MPKDGLLPFLKQYPRFFEVALSGQVNRKNKPMFTFKVIAPIGSQGPAVGGQGPSPVGPAVGGQGGISSSGGPQPQPSNAVATLPAGFGLSPVHAALAVGDFPNIPQGPPQQWSVLDVATYMDAISLPHLRNVIIEHGIDGRFLQTLQPSEVEGVGIGPVQWKKIMTFLPRW